jgi:hypothetical protein
VPWPLQEAINHGLTILSWFENFVEKELPAENLWDDAEGLDLHFAKIRDRRDGETGGTYNADEDGESGSDMVGNDLANSFKD